MKIKLNNNYTLTPKDLIEAEHLAKTKSTEIKGYGFNQYLNYLLLFALLISFLLSVYRTFDPIFLIKNEELRVLKSAQSYGEHIQEAMYNFIFFAFVLGATFPRYDIFTRWRISKKYQQNFVCREIRSILITEDILTIESANFRESRKWNSFDQVLENKQIFLFLHSRKLESIIVPKRIFDNEAELNAFRKLTESRVIASKSENA